jgi:osmotically-inducible protein OsmY
MLVDSLRAGRRALALVLVLAAVAFAAKAVAAEAMSDAWITAKVKLALLTSGDVPATAVNVDTIDGYVTLHGTVGSAEEQSMAERVARSVEGTRDVRNLLQVVKPSVQPSMKVADADLRMRIAKALKADPALQDSSVQVQSVNAGVVLLSGSARSLSEHLHAIELAAREEGVRGVASQVQSPDTLADSEVWHGGEYDATAAARSAASDMWTTSAVKVRLLANDQTPGFDINVDTDDGVVTLFGVVDSQPAKDSAAAEARSVDGVKSVANKLQVVPPARQEAVAEDDEAIDAAVSKRLDANRRLADADIEVEVRNGVARLTGTVRNHSDRLTALTLARATVGVRSLVDDLEVERPDVSGGRF